MKASNDQATYGAPSSVQPQKSTRTRVNILLLEVHLEGNLGDEMETTPLLEYLQQLKTRRDHPVDISVTAALSGWIEGAERRLSFRSVREHDKLDYILSWEEFQAWQVNSSVTNTAAQPPPPLYDIVILAPGPWKVCQLRQHVWNNRRLDVLFGGSIIAEPKTVGGPSCTLQSRMKKWNPDLVAVRETKSFQRLQPLFNSQTLALSGDLTHSFQLAPASFDYWKRHYQSFGLSKKFHIVFPRANNAQQSVSFQSRSIVLETWGDDDDNNNDTNSTVTLPAESVIFASSSAIEDDRIFQDWMYQYHTLFQAHQFVICDTVEQLFGLIANAQHVYTDRYHPGVAAHRLGVDFSIMRYEEERDKLLGLRDLVYKKGYSAESIRDEHNAKAFAMLGTILEKAALKKTSGK
jgi:polysaccharide pyruvyl transferase WcaK-like protein